MMSMLKTYVCSLKEQLGLLPLDKIDSWGNDFLNAWKSKTQLFICRKKRSKKCNL